jgi:hypothetical protein
LSKHLSFNCINSIFALSSGQDHQKSVEKQIQMSQYYGFLEVDPFFGWGYPYYQGIPTSVAPKEPGHNLHPVSNQQYPPQYSHHTYPYTVLQSTPSLPQAYYPCTVSLVPSTQYTLAPASYLDNLYQNQQLLSLMAQWPMSGPSYPNDVFAYLQNGGPMPDLNAMHTKMIQGGPDFTPEINGGLPNPPIADARGAIITQLYDEVIYLDNPPTIDANPQIHFSPLPLPPPMPDIPASLGYSYYQGYQDWNLQALASIPI